MIEFYEQVDQIIKHGLEQNSLEALRKKAKKSDQETGVQLGIPYNVQYILKRFINASMSTEPEIRINASTALRSFSHIFPIEVDQAKLVDFIIEVSNFKKSGNKKSENEACANGRILSFKALSSLLVDSINAFNSLKDILVSYPELEQEVMEACYLISQGKTLKVKFHSFSPKNQVSRFLYKILLRIKDPNNAEKLDISEVQRIIELEKERFPSPSLALEHFGSQLRGLCDFPAQFFNKYGNQFLDSDSQTDVDIHEIYYLLIIFKSFMESVTITSENYEQYFSKKMTAVWLEQLRVMNKRMKDLAKLVTINFHENSPQLAYDILVSLHEDGVYLENISLNHPLQQLYIQVDPSKYWAYLFSLCSESQDQEQQSKQLRQQIEEEEEEEPAQTFYNEIQFFLKINRKKLSLEQICSTLLLLLNKLHASKEDKEILGLVINLMGLFCDFKDNRNKKKNLDIKHKLFKNMIKILKKLKISEMSKIEENHKLQIRKSLLWLKKQTSDIWEGGKEDCSVQQINFYIFYAALIFFSLIYPEEAETLKELQSVYEDLAGMYEVSDRPKKKVKKSKDLKKPIHVLIDIFISLMTRPPGFLRKCIHGLYESIIPYMDSSDLESLVVVITTPDAEFIEEI